MLSLGSVGPQVRELQDALNTIFAARPTPGEAAIAPLAVDGIYGSATTARVRQFQSINGLTVDGMVGNFTLGAIQMVLAQLKKALPPPPPPGPRGPYSRFKALTYIGTFWNRVASDGKLATRKGYPKVINGVTIKPGMPYADFGNVVDGEEDCTHFMSCVIGQTSGTVTIGSANVQFFGGGLPISQPYAQAGVYGQDTVPNLVAELVSRRFANIVGRQFIPRNDAASEIVGALQPGDILAYASKESPSKYEHLAMVVALTGANTPDADVKIACHTKNRFNITYLDVPFPLVTMLRMPN
jgi:peptidoglycan hydrolase-like protein with peptidoglycan-binding domain